MSAFKLVAKNGDEYFRHPAGPWTRNGVVTIGDKRWVALLDALEDGSAEVKPEQPHVVLGDKVLHAALPDSCEERGVVEKIDGDRAYVVHDHPRPAWGMWYPISELRLVGQETA